MTDRFTWGFSGGLISGIIANIADMAMGAMGMTNLRFVDWTAIIIYAHLPPWSLGETIFALAGQLFFCASLGVMFVFLLPIIKSENLYLKSWFFSSAVWFGVLIATALFKVEGTIPLPLGSAISNSISSSIFGLALVPCLEKAWSVKGGSLLAQPAMKQKADDDSGE